MTTSSCAATWTLGRVPQPRIWRELEIEFQFVVLFLVRCPRPLNKHNSSLSPFKQSAPLPYFHTNKRVWLCWPTIVSTCLGDSHGTEKPKMPTSAQRSSLSLKNLTNAFREHRQALLKHRIHSELGISWDSLKERAWKQIPYCWTSFSWTVLYEWMYCPTGELIFFRKYT